MRIDTNKITRLMTRMQEIADLGIQFAHKLREIKDDVLEHGDEDDEDGETPRAAEGEEGEEQVEVPRDISRAASALGIPPGPFDWSDVQAAFRDFAKRYHPDLHQDPKKKALNERRMQKASEAYNKLKDFFEE